MPTYEYRCKSCQEAIEVFQKFTDKPLRKCPNCGGELQKVLHARGVVFKGSGFYATDSRGSATKGKSSTTPTSTDTSKPSSTPTTSSTSSSSSSSSSSD